MVQKLWAKFGANILCGIQYAHIWVYVLCQFLDKLDKINVLERSGGLIMYRLCMKKPRYET